MKSKFDLLVIGEINPDIILRGADVVPAFGQVEKLVEEAELTIGSSSVITACGAARLGLKVAFVGVVGDDLYGRYMLNAMQKRGIDTTHCIIDPTLQTGFTVILAKLDGDRAILTFSGTMAALQPQQVNRDLLAQSRHLHVGSYFLLDNLRAGLPDLFAAAQAQGMTTSLDTNWDPQEQWQISSILPHCDVLLPNETEAKKLAGNDNLEMALTKLAKIVPTLAVKCGAEGGLGQQADEVVRLRPFSVEIVDTVGAGDSFNAGFLYGFISHWSLKQSLQLALACGSLSTRAAGGTAAQPTLAEASS
ncbi:MAG: carbohydrate kinase family protein [Chloroflexi bacterium]|nr:MAG: carbohydrate kinase family protein [Chloroflexota bacterium]